MVSVANLRSDSRMAGRVLRYHTWPHIRPQTVAEHSWQVARIVLAIWPTAPTRVIRHCLLHDAGELRVGDPPYPIKADNPVLQAEMDRLEHAAVVEICSTWNLPIPGLDDDERWVFKLAEFMEMWEWGLEETLMGNRFAELVANRCLHVAEVRLMEKKLEVDSRFEKDSTFDDFLSPIIQEAHAYISRRKSQWQI